MINQINTGAVLPFFTESSAHLAHSRQVNFNVDGWKILASDRELIPFIFWLPSAPDTILAFEVINIETGKVHSLSTALIDRRKRTDNSKTWYIFDGSDISEVLPCGTYKIRVELLLSSYISDEIQVINARGPEYIKLAATGCAADVLSLQGNDTLIGSVIVERTEYRISNATAWTTLTPTGTGPYTYDIDLSSISLPAGENLLIRRTITTDTGNTLQTFHSLEWGAGDPCGTYALRTIDDRSEYANGNVWYLEFADSPLWGDKIYEAGFVERVYLNGHWDFPEAEREVEVLVDNNGNRELNTADTREFLSMVFEKIPDHLIYILSAIGDYSTISLNNVARDYSLISVPGGETEFTVEPGSGCYSRGTIRFRNDKHYETTCTTAETTVAV